LAAALGGATMSDVERPDTRRIWDANAAAWVEFSRAGFDVYRDLINTPAAHQKSCAAGTGRSQLRTPAEPSLDGSTPSALQASPSTQLTNPMPMRTQSVCTPKCRHPYRPVLPPRARSKTCCANRLGATLTLSPAGGGRDARGDASDQGRLGHARELR